MPFAPPRPCNYVGCGALTHKRYCEQHRKETQNEYKRRARERSSDNSSFYSSKRWRTVRALQLRQHPVCKCGQIAREVDHITPIKQGGDPFDPDNLQSLCKPCHSRKTAKEVFKSR